MNRLLDDCVKTGIAYLKAENCSVEAWEVVKRNAEMIGERECQEIVSRILMADGITAGTR